MKSFTNQFLFLSEISVQLKIIMFSAFIFYAIYTETVTTFFDIDVLMLREKITFEVNQDCSNYNK